MRCDVGECETRAQGAHAAGNIETDSTGRDDAAVLGIEGGDAADGEAVAPVGIGHRVRRRDDPRQAGDVGHLLGDLFVHRFQQFARSEDHPGTRMRPATGSSHS